MFGKFFVPLHERDCQVKVHPRTGYEGPKGE